MNLDGFFEREKAAAQKFSREAASIGECIRRIGYAFAHMDVIISRAKNIQT